MTNTDHAFAAALRNCRAELACALSALDSGHAEMAAECVQLATRALERTDELGRALSAVEEAALLAAADMQIRVAACVVKARRDAL
jgi:hypothetical protein